MREAQVRFYVDADMIVTRDSRIQSHRVELGAIRAHGARMIALTGREAVDIWHQLEVIMTQWRAIERLTYEPGSFIYSASSTA